MNFNHNPLYNPYPQFKFSALTVALNEIRSNPNKYANPFVYYPEPNEEGYVE